MRDSNIVVDGVKLSSVDFEHDPTTCPGCRLGNTGRHIVKQQKVGDHTADRTAVAELYALRTAGRLRYLYKLRVFIPTRVCGNDELQG